MTKCYEVILKVIFCLVIVCTISKSQITHFDTFRYKWNKNYFNCDTNLTFDFSSKFTDSIINVVLKNNLTAKRLISKSDTVNYSIEDDTFVWFGRYTTVGDTITYLKKKTELINESYNLNSFKSFDARELKQWYCFNNPLFLSINNSPYKLLSKNGIDDDLVLSGVWRVDISNSRYFLITTMPRLGFGSAINYRCVFIALVDSVGRLRWGAGDLKNANELRHLN